MSNAENAEIRLKKEFSTTLKNVRKGEEEMSALWDILKERGVGTDASDEEDSLPPDKYLSILSKFQGKMDFVDKLKSMGAKYMPNTPEHIDNIFAEGFIGDVYILYFSESTRSHAQWASTRNALTDLLLESRDA